MNKLILTGRIVRDPEVKAIGEGKQVAKFTVAVNRNYKDKDGNRPADFIPCEAFNATAEFVANYITKGRLVEVEGELRIDQYQDAEGNNKSFTKCHVNSLSALDSAKSAEGGEAAQAAAASANKPSKPAKPGLKKPSKANA